MSGEIRKIYGIPIANTSVSATTFDGFSNTITIDSTDGSSQSAHINFMSGLTVNGTISANNYIGIPLTTGGTYSNTNASLTFNNATGGTFIVSGVGETRVVIGDTNYTVSGTNNQIIAITAITTDRILTMPPATKANQRIRFIDESSQVNLTRRIIVVAASGDTFGGDPATILNFPNASALVESDGNGKWFVISTTAVQLSAGISVQPTITDLGTGSVTIGDSGIYTLFANSNGAGRPKSYAITGGTFSLTNGATNYIIADYNNGSPLVRVTTNISEINDITTIRIATIYREGITLHTLTWDHLGLALSNKLHTSIVRTQRYRIEPNGLRLGEIGTRVITITNGVVWVSAVEVPLSAVTSTGNTTYFVTQTSPGVWNTTATTTTYNNTQYNPASGGLSTLTNNRYAVNFVYRSVGIDNDLAIVLGQGDYTLGDAQTAPVPSNLPQLITTHMVLVGRIIVVKNAATATQIDSTTNNITFNSAGLTDHEVLSNLLGGNSSGHYHLTSQQHGALLTAYTLQNVYTNSSSPEITTSLLLGALTVKRGSVSDLDTVFEGRNGADITTFAVDGSGNTFARSFIKTGGLSSQFLMADGSVSTATTSSFTTGATLINNTAYFDRSSVLSAYTLDLSVFNNITSTGLLSGGTLAVGSPTSTFSLSGGTGHVVNNGVYNVVRTPVTWTGFSNVAITNLATFDYTYILVSSGGTIVQQTTEPTHQDRRDNIFIGRLNHTNRTSVSFADTYPDYLLQPNNTTYDLYDGIGMFNLSGNKLVGSGGTLSFQRTAGEIFGKSLNFTTNIKSPNKISLSASSSPAVFAYRTQTGGTSGNVSVIDPTKYDVGGVITNISGSSSQATVQRVFLYPSGSIRIFYGQTLYPTLSDALAGINSESFTLPNGVVGFAVLIGYIIPISGATNITNTSQVRIINAARFDTGFAGGGSSVSTLQNAYDNSSQPQITTNSTKGAFQIKGYDGVGTPAFQILNSAGTVTFNVDEYGNVTGTTFVKSGGTSSEYLMADGSVDTGLTQTIDYLLMTSFRNLYNY